MFHNLCSRDSPICRHMNLQCVSAKKQYGAEGEKIQITTLQLCETEEKTLLTLFIIKFERRSEQGAAPKKAKKKSVRKHGKCLHKLRIWICPSDFSPLLCIFERLPYWKINQLPCAFVRFEIRCSCGCVWIYIWDCTRTCKHFQPNWHTEYVRW